MAEIKDCIMKRVKISKNSITIKSEEGKTAGVIRNTTSLYDLQPNKQMDFYKLLKDAGLHGKISIKDCIIKDGKMFIFRNINSKLDHQKYGYFSEKEKQKELEKDKVYQIAADAGIKVIECMFT